MSEATPGSSELAAVTGDFMRRMSQGLAALANAGAVTIGSSTKDAVFSEDKVTLYRYRPSEVVAPELRVRTPLLICYALVNRPYMMDLQSDRSLIRGLLQRGVDVYLIDWGYPDGADRYLALEDYVLRYLAHCVDFIRNSSGQDQVNLLGVCQGGSMSLCYAALHPQRLRNLITMVTPVDFHTPENLLTKWARHVDVDALVAATGNISGEALNALFVSLMPFRLNSQKYVDLLHQLNDPETSAAALENFLRMEKWIFDSPDQAGEMFRQFLTLFVKRNGLVEGTVQVGGRKVDLKQIAMPVLNIYALQDHLVPPSSSRPLQQLIGSQDYSTHEFQGGHIGIYVSGTAQRQIPDRIASWLRERD
ncbi:MAG: class III poly(R)-hydroxyalkanoic acid synthase subunit PhaC [Pseudomonadota bacterium]|nr:class III poly(R)-hydroxyalkanoic acid synthase subunit PhaC [Pseudomonadota bacterium]